MDSNWNFVSDGVFDCEGLHILPKGRTVRKKRVLYRVGLGVQDIFENLRILYLL